jgi:hypothetical protein
MQYYKIKLKQSKVERNAKNILGTFHRKYATLKKLPLERFFIPFKCRGPVSIVFYNKLSFLSQPPFSGISKS